MGCVCEEVINDSKRRTRKTIKKKRFIRVFWRRDRGQQAEKGMLLT